MVSFFTPAFGDFSLSQQGRCQLKTFLNDFLRKKRCPPRTLFDILMVHPEGIWIE
jgi:hypothetical protein